jgi:predicted DNA-binding transcriptional regulator AlpA
MIDITERLLHERDAADILGVSISRLQRWRWEGRGPTFVRVGGTRGRAVRYRHSDLLQWIEANVITAATMPRSS